MTTMMYQQSGAGAVLAGSGLPSQQQNGHINISNNVCQPKERRLEACLKRFDHLLECYADLATHAEQLALGLAGPSPEPTGGVGAATPEPIALIGRLEYLTDQFEGRRQRIHAALVRLSEL